MPEENANQFIATLPEDIRAEPSLATIKDLPTLAKGYVAAQKLIGAKRIALPGENATEQQLNEFFDSIGRPKTHDAYDFGELKFKDPTMKVDESALTLTKQQMHKLGLTPKQARGVIDYYKSLVDTGYDKQSGERINQSQAQVESLKTTWGDKFDQNVEVARSVIKKFGGEQAGEIMQFLDQSGLGNNAPLAMLLHKIGSSIMEDHADAGGSGSGLPLNDQARARTEIDQLKMDKEFLAAFGDARNVGHRAAVERWMNLHKVAHPGKESEG